MPFRIVRQTNTLTVTPGAGVTTAETEAVSFSNEIWTGLPLNGLLQGIVVIPPAAVDDSATLTIALVDQDGCSFALDSGISANTDKTPIKVLFTPNATAGTDQAVPLSGYYQVVITFTEAQTTTASTTVVSLLIDEG